MTSRLVQMQARFQQKQMHEKEEKLLRLYENQQQRAFERVSRGSAGSNGSPPVPLGGGKVRQMFDERRQKAGVDRSYPLEPLKSSNKSQKSNSGGPTVRTSVKATAQRSVTQIRNGKPTVNKREIVQTVYNNNDGDETYEEHHAKYDSDDVVDMMNKHNLYDNLNDEQIPQIGFEQTDEPYLKGKLANVGGKLPSQNGLVKTDTKTTTAKPNGVPAKKEQVKPIVRKVTSPQQARSSPVAKSPSPKSGSALGSPARSKMSATRQSTAPVRAPSATKPSQRQSAKSSIVNDGLDECKHCGRRFASDRLQKHESICGKTAQKKRKVFDATKHRVQGTEMEQYAVKKGGKTSIRTSTKISGGQKKDWRSTHQEFIAAIRAAKMAQAHVAKGGKLSDLPPPPPSSNPDYVQCPHCNRRFNESAAARHVPKCATYLHNKPKANGSRASGRR